MYWPTATAREIIVGYPIEGEVTHMRSSKRGNFFATITRDTLSVWDVRPTVMQAAAVRTTASLERWGENADVIWATDGRGIILLTTTSHLLFYQLIPTSQPAYSHPPSQSFPTGGGAGEGDLVMGWELKPLGAAFVMGGCESLHAQPHALLLTLRHPPSILTVPYPIPVQLLTPPGSHFPPPPMDGDGEEQVECEVWDLTLGKKWMVYEDVPPIPKGIGVHKTPGLPTLHTLLTDDGRVYAMYTSAQVTGPKASATSAKYVGQLLHPIPPVRKADGLASGIEALGLMEDEPATIGDNQNNLDRGVHVAVTPRFGLVAIGTESGIVHIVAIPNYPQAPRLSHSLDLKHSANLRSSPGTVQCLSWTSDGYCLAVGYESGWAAWSMGGRLGGWGTRDPDGSGGKDAYMSGVKEMFWSPGNMELLMLSSVSRNESRPQLYTIPFAKSATTAQPSPDNTRYAFLQMDDRVLVYRGADQPDMSVINPESDVWQHIKIPNAYISTNWPIRYASISSDGRLIAVAGRRGLTHYSAASGRWKLFEDERQERGFTVRGGLLWFHHVLVVAVEVDRTFQIRLYSRDLDLADNNILHAQQLPSPVQVMSLLDNSLLVYTADNTLYHFLIVPTRDSIKLHLCGSISFDGIVEVPSRVRALSWLIPMAQKELGDPADDLVIATIIFLVDGKLVLLRPRRAGNQEVRYDMQILADRIEAYWTHLHGVETLENSLWGYDGSSMRIWLDALTIEATKIDSANDTYETVQESIKLRLDFYPLSILMDKAIIIGTDYETSLRSLPFPLFKIQTSTNLFLPQFLRYHLSQNNLRSALILASNYSHLVYFAHALEILLYSALEDAFDPTDKALSELLSRVIEFLDYFPQSLEVVVACARKTEVDRWTVLFDLVGKPRDLFERCLVDGKLRTAGSYLLVLHNLEQGDETEDTVRLLRLAVDAKEYQLCKELLRFLQSIDESGESLQRAISDLGLDRTSEADQVTDQEDENVLDSATKSGNAQMTHVSAGPPSNASLAPAPAPAQSQEPTPSNPISPPPSGTSSGMTSRTTSSNTATALARGSPHLRVDGADRAASPFQLTSPRQWLTPPSPKSGVRMGVMPDQLGVPEEGATPPAAQEGTASPAKEGPSGTSQV